MHMHILVVLILLYYKDENSINMNDSQTKIRRFIDNINTDMNRHMARIMWQWYTCVCVNDVYRCKRFCLIKGSCAFTMTHYMIYIQLLF